MKPVTVEFSQICVLKLKNESISLVTVEQNIFLVVKFNDECFSFQLSFLFSRIGVK